MGGHNVWNVDSSLLIPHPVFQAILDLLEYRDPQAHLGLRDLAPLEPWAPLEDQDYQGHQVMRPT